MEDLEEFEVIEAISLMRRETGHQWVGQYVCRVYKAYGEIVGQVRVRVCVCVYIYIYIHTYIHTCVCVYIYTHTHMCVCWSLMGWTTCVQGL